MKLDSTRLLVTATEYEMKVLLRTLSPISRLKTDPSHTYLYAEDKEKQLGFIVTGMGPKRAEVGLENAILRFGKVQFVVGVGFAGGLAKTSEVGKTVLPTRVLWEREEETPTEWLRMSVAAHLEGVPLRTLVTRNEMARTPIDKAALHAATGAEAVDMESVMWGKVCKSQGIPWAIIRTILDHSEDELPASFSYICDRYGRPKWNSLFNAFLFHPKDIWTTFHIQRAASYAGKQYASLVGKWLRAETKI